MATLYISYHNAKGTSRKGASMPSLNSFVLASEALTVDATGSDDVSVAAPTEGLLGDIFVRLFCDTALYFQTGSGTPSAGTATSRGYLPAGVPCDYFIESGHKIAARLVA